ncbi:hypothetical protein NZK35_10300 [Stieleria sp. ICT_E10.1]|nr:hypothetical protein [Stieleria sedimenti]
MPETNHVNVAPDDRSASAETMNDEVLIECWSFTDPVNLDSSREIE